MSCKLLRYFIVLLIALNFLIFSCFGDPNEGSQPQHFKLAYQSRHFGKSEIFLINDDGTEEKRITNNNVDDYSPVWSPDGEKILYLSKVKNKTEIWVINNDGSGSSKLVEDCIPEMIPSWAPDSLKILFVAKKNRWQNIYTINSDGTEEKQLTDKYSDSPSWAPDGKEILFIQKSDRYNQVFKINPDGTNLLKLTNIKSDCSNPVWSPDGTKIAFYGAVERRSSGLIVMNSDGSNQIKLADVNDEKLFWSPDSKKIIYPVCIKSETYYGSNNQKTTGNYYGIGIVNADGKHLPRIITKTNRNRTFPLWLMDSEKIILNVDYKLYLKGIYRPFPEEANVLNSGDIKFDIPFIFDRPSLSPDGTKIACSGASGLFSRASIYLANIDGSGIFKLTNNTMDIYPVWSPKPIMK